MLHAGFVIITFDLLLWNHSVLCLNECVVFRILYQHAIKENDYQLFMLHLLPHFFFLCIFLMSSPPCLLTVYCPHPLVPFSLLSSPSNEEHTILQLHYDHSNLCGSVEWAVQWLFLVSWLRGPCNVLMDSAAAA